MANKKYRWRALGALSLVSGLLVATGCQTNVAGMTLPSGHYLKHQPQYFPEEPAFPLTRELAAMEGAAAPAAAAQPAGPEGMQAPPPAPPQR